MRNIKLTVVVSLLIGLPFNVQAGDKTGWGLSATVGASRIEDKDGADTFSGSDFGYAFDVEYRFTPNFALGTGVFSFGTANDDFGGVPTEISAGGVDVFGRLILPVSDTVDLFGRIGSAIYFVDIDPGGVSLEDIFGDDAFEIGFGADIGRREKLAFRLEARYFNGGNDEKGTLLMLGVHYQF